jgi:sec-independent protein translocase protein TatB
MFGIDGSEFLVILIVALVVVGPKDLPKLLRTLGQWAGKARGMADQFRRSFDDMARQSELDELRKEVNKLKNQTSQPMTEADYKAIGIDLPANPLSSIEDVGAAPPKLDTPPPPAAFSSGAVSAPAEQPAPVPATHSTSST